MAKAISAVDSIYVTDENAVPLVDASLAIWLKDGADDNKPEPIVDTPVAGNNPFKTVCNTWSGFMDINSGGKRRFRCWLPDVDVEVVGSVVIFHGYAEHSGRYNTTAKYFNDHGFQVFSMDHRYHGDDPDYIGYNITTMENIDEYVPPMIELVNSVETNYPDLPYFVLGHSMGGLLTTMMTLEMQDTWKAKGVVLSDPAILPPAGIPMPYSCVVRSVMGGLATCAPSAKLAAAPAKDLSREIDVQNAAEEDPKMFGVVISASFLRAFFIRAGYNTYNRLGELKAPFSIFIGTDDKVVNPQGSRYLYDTAASEDKTKKEYEGAFHELMNDFVRDEVHSDIVNWMTERLN